MIEKETDAAASRALSSAQPPLCFVLMPFGRKSDQTGKTINFDLIYEKVIGPAVRDAGLEPIRADDEMTGGIIHKPMFERLILCEYAVADLTFANANVFYELGVRHAVRPYSTVLIFAADTKLPFDVAGDRGLVYPLLPTGRPTRIKQTRSLLRERLEHAREATVDSPVFQLVEGFPQIDRRKTDIFREQVENSAHWKKQLLRARRNGLAAVRETEQRLGRLPDVEAGILIDLFLSYRAVGGYEQMVQLAEAMPRPLARTPMIREQLAMALNRLKRRDEAARVLQELIAERGPSSETYGILGRVYKDKWDEAWKAGRTLLADGLLDQAIDAYLRGFEADWRDGYPGINAVTLMEIRQPPDPRRERLIPVVSYAVERRLTSDDTDYWDHATRLELAVLTRDEKAARRYLAKALAMIRENWEPATTANNLRLIREARDRRGESLAWCGEIEDELTRAAESAEGVPE